MTFRRDTEKPVEIQASTHNYSPEINTWKLCPPLKNCENACLVTEGKIFCIEGAECAPGASPAIESRTMYTKAIRERVLVNRGVKMMSASNRFEF